MNPVTWKSTRDNGEKVGTIVVVDGEQIYRSKQSFEVLVKHSHTGQLEWVHEGRLKPYPLRSEWEGKESP